MSLGFKTSLPYLWIALVCGLSLIGSQVRADDLDMYNRGLTAFNAGDYDSAAEIFFSLTEQSRDSEIRPRAEYYLAQSLGRRGLPVSALVDYAAILKSGKTHPFYLKAVEALVNLQERLKDQYIIPNLLNNYFSEEWKALAPEALARIQFFVAGIQIRRGNLEQARRLLLAVSPSSEIYPRA